MDDPQADPEALPKKPPPWQEFHAAPLGRLAGGFALGILFDRLIPLPFAVSIGAATLFAGLTFFPQRLPTHWLLMLSALALGAAHHQHRITSYPADDIQKLLSTEAQPLQVRGTLDDDPIQRQTGARISGPARFPRAAMSQLVLVLNLTQVRNGNGEWVSMSGRVRVTVDQESDEARPGGPARLQAGDEYEALGRFWLPRPASNPGEKSPTDAMDYYRIRAEGFVAQSQALVRLDRSPRWSDIWAKFRRDFGQLLDDTLPEAEAATARALLLGDGSRMQREEWDAYIRTGVIHVLAISGQHLAILATFLWAIALLLDIRPARAAWFVLAVILAYTILTGSRPSGVRSAVMVSIVCGGYILGRPPNLANSYSLAILVVLLLNPLDLFNLGCQLSFLAVFVLLWGCRNWFRWTPDDDDDPLAKLVDAARPIWLQHLLHWGRIIGLAYATTAMISFITAPLLLREYNLISLGGIFIGPVLVILTTVALIAGFVLLAVGSIWPILASPFAIIVGMMLHLAGLVVRFCDTWPRSSLYLTHPPDWWTIAFYLLVLVGILRGLRWHWLFLLLCAWGIVGLAWPAANRPTDELRLTVLAVGKGSCLVLECPDGRCLVYDAGSAIGANTMRRVVAPFLWSRGIQRIDELFLSHADSDHFNGVSALLQRFRVGHVTLTPSFADKPTAEVGQTLLALEQARVPRRIATIGDAFQAGGVEIDVLHPPEEGPAGTENERSLVLLVRYQGFRILLTGDLEKAGTRQLLQQPAQPVDVLVAPHHGSKPALPAAFLDWCQPRFLVVSRGPAFGNTIRQGPDTQQIPTWDTDTAGAVTIRCHQSGIVAEGFRSQERLVVARQR